MAMLTLVRFGVDAASTAAAEVGTEVSTEVATEVATSVTSTVIGKGLELVKNNPIAAGAIGTVAAAGLLYAGYKGIKKLWS